MKVYLAARYSRREEIVEYRTMLENVGFKVTSRWLDGEHSINDTGIAVDDAGEPLVDPDSVAKNTFLRQQFARDDLADIMAADMLVLFTEAPGTLPNRGGRMIEFGFALHLGKQLAIVGPRENLFMWLPEVQQFDSWDHFYAFWTSYRGRW